MSKESTESNQQIMEKLFPERNTYPIDSMIPKVFYYNDKSDEPIVVAFLIRANDFMIKGFRLEAPDEETIIDCEMSLEENDDSGYKDLVISFIFPHPTGDTMFTTTIPGEEPQLLRRSCEDLLRVEKLYIFVADKDFKLVNVNEISWNPPW
ncbi:MAG: hypothetical protein A4E53_02150 [Pelotomaculum sp. PtaB.Bin104]|nr:MAG: hypothetical protein A4E53_02150 [Pelotomaculum sp. PtaB.Bin104]